MKKLLTQTFSLDKMRETDYSLEKRIDDPGQDQEDRVKSVAESLKVKVPGCCEKWTEAAGEWQAARGIITQSLSSVWGLGLGLFSLPATFTRFYHTGHPQTHKEWVQPYRYLTFLPTSEASSQLENIVRRRVCGHA